MRQITFFSALAIAVATLSPFGLYAAQVSFTQTQPQPEIPGEIASVLTFDFLNLPQSTGQGGTFIFRAAGDLGNLTEEYVTWTIENLLNGGPIGPFDASVSPPSGPGGPFDFVIPTGTSFFDVQRTYAVDANTLDAILSDGAAQIIATYGISSQGEPSAFATVTLTYNAVPEPSTLAMLLAALPLGYLAYRRR